MFIVLLFGTLEGQVILHLVALVFIVDECEAGDLLYRHPSRIARVLPVAVVVVVAVAIDIVRVAEEGDARLRREAQGKGTGVVVVVGAVARRGICNPSDAVLPFQYHVNGQLPLDAVEVLGTHAHHGQPLGCPFIDFHVLHHIGGQVVECHLGIALEEIFAVDQQALHLAAIDEDLPVGLQSHAWQHGDELVKHGTRLQLEGVGMIDHRVAVHHHLNLCGRDRHLAQRVFMTPWLPRHQYLAKGAARLAKTLVVHGHRGVGGLVASFLETDDGLARMVCHNVIELPPSHAVVGGEERLARHAVLVHERQHHGVQILMRERVADKAVHGVADALLRLVLHEDLCTLHLYLHRLSLAHLLHRLLGRQVLDTSRDAQVFQVVMDENNGVFILRRRQRVEHGSKGSVAEVEVHLCR